MHKLVGVELRLYAAQEMQQGGDPGRTWHRICPAVGVEGWPKNDDGDDDDVDLSHLPGGAAGGSALCYKL